MSEYGYYTTKYKPASLLSHDSVNGAKEERKKLLEAVEARR
jgi:hypothetical protein